MFEASSRSIFFILHSLALVPITVLNSSSIYRYILLSLCALVSHYSRINYSPSLSLSDTHTEITTPTTNHDHIIQLATRQSTTYITQQTKATGSPFSTSLTHQHNTTLNKTTKMCIRLIEIFAVCGCVYHVHSVDPCAAVGHHAVQDKYQHIGYMCPKHGSGR